MRVNNTFIPGLLYLSTCDVIGQFSGPDCTDEGHSPETSGPMFKFFGTFSNILNFNFLF